MHSLFHNASKGSNLMRFCVHACMVVNKLFKESVLGCWYYKATCSVLLLLAVAVFQVVVYPVETQMPVRANKTGLFKNNKIMV